MVEAGKGTYQGKKESDLIDEKIDEVILRALGLDDVFDLDYDTYKTLLKERMMADRMGQKMDSGESEAVTDEYKRVKTKVGRFRLNKKKINVGSFKTKTSKPASESIKPVAKMLPGSTFSPIQKSIPPKKEPEVTQQKAQKEKPPSTKKEPKVAQQEPQKEKKPFTYNFKKIENILSDIIKNLKETFSFEKNTEKEKNQEEGRKKKKERESTLEKTIGVVAKIGKKILEPLKGPLDYIINWITYTFLGKVFNNILNWVSNPDNSKKMMSITRFLKDWWPALVGAYVIFGTSLGGFVSKLIFTVGAFTAKMLIGAIPKLLSLAKSPLGAGALLLGAGAAIPMLMPETVNEQERKTEDKVKKKGKDKVRAELERQANNPNLYERLTGQDAEAKEQLYKIETGETKSYRRGGEVTGQSGTDIRGAGADTQLIAAQPGEIVINKPTVNALGPEFFLALNKKHGGSGANKPKMANNIQTAAGGGLVLPAFSSGGMIGGTPKEVKLRKSYDYRFGKDFTSKLTNDQISSISKHYNSLPDQMSSAIESRRMQGYPDELKDMAERMIKGQKPKSFAQMARTAAGIDDLGKQYDLDRKTNPMRGYADNLPKLNTPKPIQPSASVKPDLVKNIRAPIPASRAIVPYVSGGALARQGGEALATKPIQQIGTNMNVPGGRIRGGSLSAIMAAFEMKQRKDEGQTNVQAGLGAGGSALGGQLGWIAGAKAGAIAGAALGSIVPGLGTGVGAAVGAIVGGLAAGYGGAMLGGKLADDFSGVNATKERNNRGGMGGAIKGGFGLKDQSFKDAPKTQIMTDDKGRPFVGYKSMKNGKLHYSRGSQPGTSTTNPLEMLGRFINPGAYKDNDAKLAMEKQRVAATDSLEGFQKQGMLESAQARMMKQIGGNLKDTQNDLSYRQKQAKIIKPKSNQQRLEEKRPFYDPFGIFGGASAKIQKKQGGGLIGMQGGGSIEGKSDAPFGTRLIRLLGDLGLPNTGNVMAPRSSGPKDVRGIRQTSAGYENRLFGSRLGTYFPSGLRGEYDEMEKKRYYQRSGKSFRSTLYGTLDPDGYIPHNAEEGMPGLYTPPKSRRQQQQQKPQTNESLIGNSFRDFGKNVQTIKDASKAREEMMLQMGIKPDGYVNLGGRPIKKKQGGGGIKENTGMNIAGAAADRQLIAAQPGEYMLTLDTVAKLGGVGAIDRLVARLDSNSNPAKMGKNLKPLPGPPSAAGRSGMMTLPPISGGSGGGSGGGGGKGSRKQVPSFSATSPYVGERQNKADIYGIK